MIDKELDLNDYIEIAKRRKRIVIASFILIFGLTAVVTYMLPSIYRSTGVILINEEGIPGDLVQSAATNYADYADRHIQSISIRIFTRKNLLKIIDKFNLYPDKQDDAIDSILANLRDAITFKAISADIVDRRSGRLSKSTIAVNVAFDHTVAGVAQKVANELTSLFLNENIVIRTKTADENMRFLSGEAKRLRNDIREFETKIGEFKQKNLNQLPELKERNLTEIDRIDRELINVDAQVNMLLERKYFLEGELGQIDPYMNTTTRSGERVYSKRAQLNSLKAQYPLLLSKYSPTHPSVTTMDRQIRALESELGVSSFGLDSGESQKQLRDMRTQLTLLKKRYSKKHPDIKKLQQKIKVLEAANPPGSARKATPTKPQIQHPDNPAYISLKSQLEGVESKLRLFNTSKIKITEKQDDIRLRLINTPLKEIEYNDLLQDYNDAVQWYKEVKAKERRAKIAQNLEIGKQSEQFTLLEPPNYPIEPIKPNRIRLLLLGLVSAIFGAIVLTAIREVTDKTVYSSKRVILASGAPPIAVIPYFVK